MSAAKKECSPEYRDHVIPPGDNRNGGCARGRLSLAYDRWNYKQDRLGKGYISFASRAELFSWYKQQNPRCAYEILRESEPICLGFDIESDSTKEDHVEVRNKLKLGTDPAPFLANITRRLAVMFPQLADGDPLVSTSHKFRSDEVVKISFHLKYPHLRLDNMEQRQLLSNVLRRSELFPVVDPQVYSLNRLTVAYELDVAVSPEEAWSYVTAFERTFALWDPAVVSCAKLTPGETGVGTQYDMLTTLNGARSRMRCVAGRHPRMQAARPRACALTLRRPGTP